MRAAPLRLGYARVSGRCEPRDLRVGVQAKAGTSARGEQSHCALFAALIGQQPACGLWCAARRHDENNLGTALAPVALVSRADIHQHPGWIPDAGAAASDSIAA